MRVLLACVHHSGSEACLTYTVGLLNAQSKLLLMQDVQTEVSFFDSVHAALVKFGGDTGFDVLIVTDTMLGLNADFITETLKTIEKLHFVVGAAPLPGVNWDVVAKKLESGSQEDVRYQGLTYNVEFSRPITGDDSGDRLAVKSALLKTFAIDRSVYDRVAPLSSSYVDDKGTTGHLVWAKGVQDNALLDEGSMLMRRWGDTVWVDVTNRLTGFGVESFQGAVGFRERIR